MQSKDGIVCDLPAFARVDEDARERGFNKDGGSERRRNLDGLHKAKGRKPDETPTKETEGEGKGRHRIHATKEPLFAGSYTMQKLDEIGGCNCSVRKLPHLLGMLPNQSRTHTSVTLTHLHSHPRNPHSLSSSESM